MNILQKCLSFYVSFNENSIVQPRMTSFEKLRNISYKYNVSRLEDRGVRIFKCFTNHFPFQGFISRELRHREYQPNGKQITTLINKDRVQGSENLQPRIQLGELIEVSQLVFLFLSYICQKTFSRFLVHLPPDRTGRHKTKKKGEVLGVQ